MRNILKDIPSRKHLLLMLVPGAVFVASIPVLNSVPRPWAWIALPLIVITVTITIVLFDRRTRVLDEHRRSGRCRCGFDLRATPPKHVSVHSFGVDARMSSTKKTMVCPECGEEHTVWEDR